MSLKKILHKFEDAESGLTLVNMLVGIVLLSLSIVIVTGLLSTSTTTLQAVMRRGEMDDIRTHVRLTLDCQQTFRAVPSNKAACSSGGSIQARDKNGNPFPTSNNNVFSLGKYEVRLDCNDLSTHYGVSTKVRLAGSNDPFVETSKIPLACKRGCEPDYQMSLASYSNLLAMSTVIPRWADPTDMPDNWQVSWIGESLAIAHTCSGWSFPNRGALYLHQPTADRVCRCMGYGRAWMQHYNPQGAGDGGWGFDTPNNDELIQWWGPTSSWYVRNAAWDNRWIGLLYCYQPICK